MRKLILLLIAISCCALSVLQAQPKLLDKNLKPKLFTLRNSRLSLGFLYHGNFINEKKEPVYQRVRAELPNAGKVEYGETTFPYMSAGLHLDLFSPNSRIGFDFGVEYNLHDFSIATGGDTYKYSVSRLVVPAALRYRFGSVHSKNNLFLMTGVYYSLPLNFMRSAGGAEKMLSGVQQSALGFTSSLGYEVRLTKKQAEENAEASKAKTGKRTLYSEYPRVWLFLRTDHLLDSMLAPGSSERIIPGTAVSGFELSSTNLSLGLSFFFGGKVRLL